MHAYTTLCILQRISERISAAKEFCRPGQTRARREHHLRDAFWPGSLLCAVVIMQYTVVVVHIMAFARRFRGTGKFVLLRIGLFEPLWSATHTAHMSTRDKAEAS